MAYVVKYIGKVLDHLFVFIATIGILHLRGVIVKSIILQINVLFQLVDKETYVVEV